MSTTHTDQLTPRKPLRLWPGVVAATLVLVGYVMPIFTPENAAMGMIGAAIGALLIILWWLLFSRARWYERVGAIVLLFVAVVVEKQVVHPSIAGGGMGMLSYILVLPTLTLALVAWAAASRRLGAGARGAAVVVAILLGCLPWMLLRTGGMNASGRSDFHWRWSPTPEERLLAQAYDLPAPAPAAPAVAEVLREPAAPLDAARGGSPVDKAAKPVDAAKNSTGAPATATAKAEPARAAGSSRPAEWPGFRGRDRDDVVHGVQIATDWAQSPPVQLWKRPIGPGWSSFAVNGNLFYTQEQRGEDEVVSCYKVSTGEPVWTHRDAARFWESNAGAGPRGTPTLSNGRVYTLGATGIVNALDGATGAVFWSHNAASDTRVKIPIWGIASSPLVVDDVVIVATGGKLAAYDIATGTNRWTGGGGGFSYSSPHLVRIDGVPQVLFISGPGTISVEPATGKVLWQHAWEGGSIVQPAMTADGDLLVNAMAGNGGLGMRRLAVAHKPGGWAVDERWTSTGLKPYFNDFVVHKGHAFGFDGSILSCIDLQDGQRKWKGGRYGNGQLLLLADQDLLLVLTEEGDLALVKATPDQFTEVAKFPGALEGKTWNHPVLVGDRLLVRNDQEMAAFRLSRAAR